MNAGKRISLATCMLAMTGLMYGCGTDEPPQVVTTFTGVVQQGPISGATVYLDLNNNSKLDSGEPSATTNATGGYTMSVTKAQAAQITATTKLRVAFTAASRDTVTNAQPTGILASPAPSAATLSTGGAVAAATNVTPITTLVAFTPPANVAALKTKLATIGVTDTNAPISNGNASPAAIALAKSIETALSSTQNALADTNATAANTLTEAAAGNIGTAISTSALNLATPADLATTVAAGVATTFTAPPAGVFTAAGAPTAAQVTTIQNAVNTAVTTVATQVSVGAGTGGGALAIVPVAGVTETSIVNAPGVAAALETAQDTAQTAIDAVPIVTAPVTGDTTAPTIVGSTTQTVTTIPSSISFQFSEAIKADTGDLVVRQGNATTGTIVQGTDDYNASTFVVTFVPSTPLLAGQSYFLIISGVQDQAGNAMPTTTLTLNIAAAATGATGGTGGSTGGTGINF